VAIATATLTTGSSMTRGSVWKLFNDAWGGFFGGITTGFFKTTAESLFQEPQILFHPRGHTHGASDGAIIISQAIAAKMFDLNENLYLRGNYWGNIRGNVDYAFLGGYGFASFVTSYYSGVVGTWVARPIYVDYDPGAMQYTGETIYRCTLDIRNYTAGTGTITVTSVYDTAYGTLTTRGSNWTIVWFGANPCFQISNGASWPSTGNIHNQIYNVAWMTNTTGPYVVFAAYVGTGLTPSPVSMRFSYGAVVRKL
jgi:hypothetical protein